MHRMRDTHGERRMYDRMLIELLCFYMASEVYQTVSNCTTRVRDCKRLKHKPQTKYGNTTVIVASDPY